MTDRQFIKKLSEHFAERRSDVSAICDEFLKTGKFEKSFTEHRFVTGTIPGTDTMVEYDTLTTVLSFRRPADKYFTTLSNITYTN